ncbi:MAG: hypothetical protein K2G63_03595, partial [Oscillospiraceae bacterium]|nr:hypothetical protein [Oscillospiraceae bacterium]
MKKQFIKYAVTALALSTLLSINTVAVETTKTTDNNIKIDESGNITLISDYDAKNEVTAFQLNLKVEADAGADISFKFNPENSVKVSRYRYDADSNYLNIYIADSQPIFNGSDLLDIGAVSAKDTAGNSIDVKVDVVKDSLKYVYRNTLADSDFDVEIATTTTTTTTTESTTTTTTTTIATTTEEPVTTTTTEITTIEPITSTTTTMTAEPTTSIITSTTTTTVATTTVEPVTTTVATTEKPVATTASIVATTAEPVITTNSAVATTTVEPVITTNSAV